MVFMMHQVNMTNHTISLFTLSKQKWPFGEPAFIQPIRAI